MSYPPPPPPNSAPQEEKNWALLAHAVPLAAMWFSVGTLGFIAGIVIYFLAKDKGSLARNYASQALNIQLNALIYLIVSFILCFVLIGFFLIPVVFVWATILHVICIVKSNQSELWVPPFLIRFVQ